MSEPTVVFVFDLKNWYGTITPLSKIDLLDIVPHVCVQFGFDQQSQSYLLVITKSKWDTITPEVKSKYMMISRRIKEEMEGPMTSIQREQYETTDIFNVFTAPKDVPEPDIETGLKAPELPVIPEIPETPVPATPVSSALKTPASSALKNSRKLSSSK
jgi:hypothetical protein